MTASHHGQTAKGSRAPDQSRGIPPETVPSKPTVEINEKTDEQSPRGEGLLDLLKRAAEASLVFGALLFVIGWSYLDGYYATFALKVGQLGISNQEAALSSFKFIFHGVWQTLLVCLGLAIIGIIGSYLYRQTGWKLELVTLCLLLAVLLFSGVLAHRAFVLGHKEAWNDMRTETTTLPRVQVEVERSKVSNDLINFEELASKKYRLLLQTESRVWIFKSVDNVEGVISIVTLPKDTVRIMTIERATPKGGGL